MEKGILYFLLSKLVAQAFSMKNLRFFIKQVEIQEDIFITFMNIGLFGYGKMGKIVESVAITRGHQISEILSGENSFQGNADVYIDFSLPEAVFENAKMAIENGIPIVIGTTGWLEKKATLELLAQQKSIPAVYGGNFSLGVNLFWRSLEKTAKEFSAFAGEYDVFVHEFHHREKKDSPSGTAITTAEILLDAFPKNRICTESVHERIILPEELHTTSTRGGSIPGTHCVYFDSLFDTIEITHRARTREGFALGAVLAAENIKKLSSGLHHFPEIFDILFSPR
jgi:4-hydroxy-tetrahydrodipicolinate reductase